jgi:hypothetical protein
VDARPHLLIGPKFACNKLSSLPPPKHSFQGIHFPPLKKGKKCNLRVRYDLSPMCRVGHQQLEILASCWGSQRGNPFVADGFRLILFLFFLGILSGIDYGFDSLGDRIHSLFPPALAVNILGHAIFA